jgi:S-adenosylmethionine:tRNA ribosyltransferase-isomerase
MTAESKVTKLRLEDFEYDLPSELIAQEPVAVRDQARLMVVDRAEATYAHTCFQDIVKLLSAGDVLVVNDTRVIPARLFAQRASGGTVKLLLLRAMAGQPNLWEALVTPIKRLRAGEVLEVNQNGSTGSHPIHIENIITAVDGHKRLILDLGLPDKIFSLLAEIGGAPLPPYIRRDREQEQDIVRLSRTKDLERYQTVFACAPGAVAAPTAGLHFSNELISQLTNKGVHFCKVTLHVGPGTFKPISTSIENHVVEQEVYSISDETVRVISRAKTENRRIIAVGTTTLRAVETAGVSGTITPVQNATTSLYVRPGYKFKIVDALVTNFHLSKSSLLVLVAAFAGRDLIMHAYEEAIKERYRFFSYGDAMIIV